MPWDDAGPYIRFSVTFQAASPEEEKDIVREIGARLADVPFEF